MNRASLRHWEKTTGYLKFDEAQLLAHSVEKHVPKDGIVVEFGPAFGKSTGVIAASLPAGAMLYTYDLWIWADLPEMLSDENCFLHEWFPALSETQLRMKTEDIFRKNIQSFKNVVAYNVSEIGQNFIFPAADLMFIDAGHEYPDVKKDITAAMSSKARVIVLHDYDQSRHPGVSQAAWELLKRRPDYIAGSLAVWEMSYGA